MTQRSRGRLPFVQRNRNVVISDGDTAVKLEFLFQTDCALEPFRALLWIPHRESEVTHHSKFKWDFHVRSLKSNRPRQNRYFRRVGVEGNVPEKTEAKSSGAI